MHRGITQYRDKSCSLNRMEQHRLWCFRLLAEGKKDPCTYMHQRLLWRSNWPHASCSSSGQCSNCLNAAGVAEDGDVHWVVDRSTEDCPELPDRLKTHSYFVIFVHWQHCLREILAVKPWICGEITAANALLECPFIVKCESLSRIQQIIRWFS